MPIFKVNFLSLLLVVLVFVGLFYIVEQAVFDLEEALVQAEGWMESWGFWFSFLFVVFYAVATAFFFWLPVWPLTVLAGALFGLKLGLIYSLLGTVLGSVITLVVVRALAPRLVYRLLKSWQEWFDLKYYRLGKNRFRAVIFLRLLYPILPLRSVNYVLALSGISGNIYILGTLVGLLPSSILFVYLGTTIAAWEPVFMAGAVLLAIILSGSAYGYQQCRGGVSSGI